MDCAVVLKYPRWIVNHWCIAAEVYCRPWQSAVVRDFRKTSSKVRGLVTKLRWSNICPPHALRGRPAHNACLAEKGSGEPRSDRRLTNLGTWAIDIGKPSSSRRRPWTVIAPSNMLFTAECRPEAHWCYLSSGDPGLRIPVHHSETKQGSIIP